jgi:hypothetical protein
MKNPVFWDIKPSSYLTGNTLVLSNRTQPVRFEVFTATTMKNAVFWDIKTQFVPTGKTLDFSSSNKPVNANKI